MMIQCTRAEALDAHAAELWLASLPPSLRQREPYMTFAHRLIARYGPIMSPRRLLCPRCVGGPGAGVSYGNNPETVRQGWRRRNRRPDTTITANPHALLVPLNHFTHYNYDLAQMNINATRRPRKAEA